MWLRTAAKEDIEAIRELLLEVWHEAYDGLIGSNVVEQIIAQRYALDSLKKCLVRPSSEYVVSDDGETLQGVSYGVQGGVKGHPDTVLLSQLYVRPQFQNQGIGKRLLIEIEESFPNARRMRVMVIEKNQNAVHFYESQGYKKVGNSKPTAEYPDILEVALEKELV